MKYKITATSPLASIIIESSSYVGSSLFQCYQFRNIFLELKEEDIDKKAIILNKLNSNGFDFRKSSMYGPYILTSDDIHKLREIIDFLYINNLINSADRADIEATVLRVEKDTTKISLNVSSINVAQQDIINAMCEEQIDHLINSMTKPDDIKVIFDILNKNYYTLPDGKLIFPRSNRHLLLINYVRNEEVSNAKNFKKIYKRI